MPEKKKDSITLGSGDFYIMEFDGTVPELETMKTEENRLAHTKGGASIEYTVETYTEKDDFGRVSKTIITTEEAILKGGLLAWDGVDITKLCATARISEDSEKGIRTVKIGGTANDNGKSYAVLFHHPDAKDGDQSVLVVGKNTAGLTITYSTDEGSVLEPEFTAEPMDDEGTLIQFTETIPKASGTAMTGQALAGAAVAGKEE